MDENYHDFLLKVGDWTSLNYLSGSHNPRWRPREECESCPFHRSLVGLKVTVGWPLLTAAARHMTQSIPWHGYKDWFRNGHMDQFQPNPDGLLWNVSVGVCHFLLELLHREAGAGSHGSHLGGTQVEEGSQARSEESSHLILRMWQAPGPDGTTQMWERAFEVTDTKHLPRFWKADCKLEIVCTFKEGKIRSLSRYCDSTFNSLTSFFTNLLSIWS